MRSTLLAKQCGANVSDSPLQRTLVYRYAGRGSPPPYGDHSPETSFVDNGKNGKLAMTAAATLIPDSGKSVYAEARDQMGQ